MTDPRPPQGTRQPGRPSGVRLSESGRGRRLPLSGLASRHLRRVHQTWRFGDGRALPLAVVSAVVLLCAATAGAGLASVTAVAEQDLLLANEARIASILADAGRAEALVAQLADPRANPAYAAGMREELTEAARRMDDHVAGLEAAVADGDHELVRALGTSGPELLVTAQAFARDASLAASPQARLEPGQLRRGSLDGLYGTLREQGDRVRYSLVAHATAEKAAWTGVVSAGMTVAWAAAAAAAVLTLGPVRGRLRRQRQDEQRLARARETALAQLQSVLDSIDVPVLVAGASGCTVTGNRAARSVFPALRATPGPVRELTDGVRVARPDDSEAPDAPELGWDDLPMATVLRHGDPVSEVLLIGPDPRAAQDPARSELRRYVVDARPVTGSSALFGRGPGRLPNIDPSNDRGPEDDTEGAETARDAGDPVAVVATFQDITELQQRTDQLARHAEHLSAITAASTAVLRHDDARGAVCQAAMEVVRAELAILFEDDGHGDLVCTASAGADAFGMRLPIKGRSVTASVFATARPRSSSAVTTEPDIDDHAIGTLSRLCGRDLTGGVWIPVVSAGRCRAVLAIGFADPAHSVVAVSGAGAGGLGGGSGPRGVGGVDEAMSALEIIATEAAVALDRQDLIRRLSQDAEADPLTGAANRRVWDLELTRAVDAARATGTALSMIMLDLDHFKAYNDTHGHPAGDALLRQTVAAWRGHLRPHDLLARYGGEEFAVLLPGCPLPTAARIADTMRQLIPARQTCSAGTAQLAPQETGQDLLSRADRALYDAKHAGRNQTAVAG